MEAIKFKIEVPCKAYIRKYVIWHYNYQEPLPLDRKTFPGLILLNLLEKPAKYGGHAPKQRDAVLHFEMKEYLSWYHGTEISENAVFIFHNVMDALYRQELFALARGLTVGDPTPGAIKAAIDVFREKYQIEEDDFSYENFRKTIYRERTRENQNKVRKIFKTVVP